MLRTFAIAVLAALAAAPAATAVKRPGTFHASLGRFSVSKIEGLDVGRYGQIVIAGRLDGYPLRHPWVRMYLPDGTPDATFGQDGFVALADDRRAVAGALVQDDGRVIVAQSSDRYFEPVPHLVTRLTPDGRPDPSFGSGGSIQTKLGATGTSLTDIALQPDGRLIVLGTRATSSPDSLVIVVARYMPNGSPDSSFGLNGVTEVPTRAGQYDPMMAIQPGGGVLLTVPDQRVPAIARLTADGHLDESFGAGGLAPPLYAEPEWADQVHETYRPPPVVVDSNGRIRIGVEFSGSGGRYRMGLIGLTADGRPDRAFANGGRALGPLPKDGGESASTAVGDSRGGIIVAGSRSSGEEFAFEGNSLIRRFRADGSLDRSFGAGGVVVGRVPVPGSGYAVFQQRLAFVDRDTLVLAEHVFDGKYGFWGNAVLETLHAGYDRDDPSISLVAGCRALKVRVADLSAMDAVVVRGGGRVIRRTKRKRFRMRAPRGTRRVSVRATDLAGNVATRKVRLPRC